MNSVQPGAFWYLVDVECDNCDNIAPDQFYKGISVPQIDASFRPCNDCDTGHYIVKKVVLK